MRRKIALDGPGIRGMSDITKAEGLGSTGEPSWPGRRTIKS
jgi:hypothetical protein